MDKCRGCYKFEGCLLTNKMRERCAGPFPGRVEQIKAIRAIFGLGKRQGLETATKIRPARR